LSYGRIGEASETRDYCIAKNAMRRGSPRSFVRAKNARSQDDNRSADILLHLET